MQPNQPLAYTVKEATALAKLSTTSIYEAFKAGKLKPRKYGHKTLILADDLKAFLEGLPMKDGGMSAAA